eukprot:3905957-Pyramimonas_sp.AAC.1
MFSNRRSSLDLEARKRNEEKPRTGSKNWLNDGVTEPIEVPRDSISRDRTSWSREKTSTSRFSVDGPSPRAVSSTRVGMSQSVIT